MKIVNQIFDDVLTAAKLNVQERKNVFIVSRQFFLESDDCGLTTFSVWKGVFLA